MGARYYGDNLKWLRHTECLPNASADLVYLDPPFKSDANYNAFFQGKTGAALRVAGEIVRAYASAMPSPTLKPRPEAVALRLIGQVIPLSLARLKAAGSPAKIIRGP